jgi:hypothetical protein
MRILVFAMPVFAFLSSLFAGAPEIYHPSKDGWCDLTFRIDKSVTADNGAQILACSGVHQGEIVGFTVELSAPPWKGGQFADTTTHQGVVSIVSAGKASDSFIRVLEDLYGIPGPTAALRKRTDFTGISLQGDPQKLKEGLSKIKLFFEADRDEDYAEAYLNIDVGNGTVELAEKDTEYRGPLVRALKQ